MSKFSAAGHNQKVIFTPRTKFRNVLGDRRTEETIFLFQKNVEAILFRFGWLI